MTQQRARSHRGQITFIAIGVVAVALLILAGLAWRSGGGEAVGGQADNFAVRRGSFDISIPVTGELAALKQIEIRNSLDSRAVITDIVAEGTYVQAGEVVLRLNDEEIRNRLRDAQDRLNVADAALIAAQAKLDIQIKTREAELAKADLAIKLADLALKAWQEGEAKTKLEELKLAVDTAKKEFQRVDDRYKESIELVKKEFISNDELRRDEITKMKAEFDLAKAMNQLMVYEEYQFDQEKAQKESDLEQAISERDRVDQQTTAEVRSATSDVESKQFQLDSAKEKLQETQLQLAHCTVTAPSPGLVVYYASTQSGMGGRNEGRPPMVGTELTRNEMVIILPDTSQMIAAVKVSEALVGQIEVGQRATVTSDAMPDRSLNGQVIGVGVMAESGGWRDPNRRDYTVRIRLNEGGDSGLKPSMRCKANIYVGRIQNALHVPIQAVYRVSGISFVYVPQGNGFAEKRVTVGPSSELYIEIVEGLDEGQVVLLRQPQPEEIVFRLPIPKTENRSDDDAEVTPAPLAAGPESPESPEMGGGGSDRPQGGRRGSRGPGGGPRPDGARGGGSEEASTPSDTATASPTAPATPSN